jgi:amino acid adenylation domain-containing protein
MLEHTFRTATCAAMPGGAHHLFEEAASRTPDAVALRWADGETTYGELDRRASAIAAELRRAAAGAGPEARVGIALDRSPELVAAILGALKAGAAFVPLDPAYPPDRLAYMVRDAGVRLALTSPDIAPTVRAAGAEPLVAAGDAEPDGVPAAEAEADGLAYVIYTSGSTGRPKGVGVTHRGVCNTVRAQAGLFGVRPGDRVLQFASPSFDASVSEIFVTLAAGAELHLAPREEMLPGPGLASLLASRGITHVTLPPSALALLPEGRLPALRTLVTAGEACPAAVARRWAGGRRLVNAYGPTETAICATAAVVGVDDGTPPIGTAIDGARVYLLDPELAPVDDGEVFVAGQGVARGYLGRPALTAERFLPDPFADVPGARMYRTGDRARRRPDGALEFAGRLDDQVKVRGHRVEPGEVEAALAAHPAVAQAAVAARPDPAGGSRLVAYVVAAEGAEVPRAEELRGFVAQSLPEHMLPSAFVSVAALPTTPAGKVDRRALPSPPAGRPALSAPYVAPRTPAEREVAAAWSQVLGIEGVGALDGFYELGGHSLAAVQAASRLRRPGAEVPLSALLGGATVESAAREVEAARERGAAPAFPPIRPAARGVDLPPSFSQERVWFITQLAPENLSYHAHAALIFRGPLDVAALEAALQAVVDRHEVLRTTFPTVDGRPVQRIHAPWRVCLDPVDFTHLPEAEREEAAREWMREHFGRRFDLSRLPLVRWTLLRLADDEHRLVHVEHHIIHDGWSFNVLLREALEVYRARVEGRAPKLPGLPLQFADYCVWQREWMRSPAALAQLAFWREKLAGSQPVLELPHDRPRPPLQRFRGAAPRFRLPGRLYRELRALGHAEGATLYMTMLAAFTALLSRWSGQDDLNVGTGIAVRRQPEVEGILGMFVNSLVLRADLSGEPTFRELLGRIRRTTLDAYAHQDAPFEAVVDAVRPDRNPAHNPLFQAMFSFHDSVQPELALPGVEVEMVVALSNQSAKFDLNVVAIPHGEQRARRAGAAEAGDDDDDDADAITLVWEHDSDLFDLSTMERMFRHFRALLEAAVADPEVPVSRLRMLDDDEAAALLDAGRAVRAFPAAGTIHGRFEEAARARPAEVALTWGDERLTYAGLNARANRLAHHLRALGVGPETRVGVCLERSADLVVALLAVLKAGGAYVPLDPAYPAERIAFVLEDAGVPVLVTREATRAALPPHAARAVCVDRDAAEIAANPARDPESGAGAGSLAYVIYTSGSTGKPKGVLVEHAGVLRLLDSTEAWFGFGPDDVWTLFHSASFDFSVWEIWGALLYGGRLVVVPYLVSRSPDDFHRLLVREGVTVLNQTPSAFRQLVEADAASGVEPGEMALRWVIFGGEALDPQWLAPWFERHGDERPALVNMYGITETTVHVTWRRLARADLERPGSPIGVPLPDLSLYLLDGHLQPVPPGVAGEIFVGGAGVARGYLDRPELTAERFVRDPFSDDPGARLYRSGDLARRRADGELEYLGRADQQVKVRGFRIEPGEIEAVLAAHPEVAHAAVVAREDAPGDRRLVAYVVGHGGEAPAAAALRPWVGARLPEHMVPAAFVALPALPLTAHGKLDRGALPAPEAESGEDYAPPRTPLEAALAAVWAEVLGVERVGIDDNYFALGGDSIRTVRLVGKARERGIPVALPQVFRHQTVRLLAAAVAGCTEGAAAAHEPVAPFALVPAEVRRRLPAEVEDAYPLAALQLGMLYHSELDPASVRYHNVNSYRMETAWDEAALREAVRRLSARHPVLRTSFDLASFPEPLQLVHAGAEVPLGIDDLRGEPRAAQEAALDAWTRAERDRRFDCARAPLVRFHAHRLTDGVFHFSVTEHHAVLDGWSVATMLTELFRSYAALRDGAPDPTGDAPRLGYRDFVALERGALASDETRRFWARRLDGAETTRIPRAGTGETGPASHAVELPDEASRALARAAARAGVPLKSVLLAAHLRVLSALAGRRQVLTGLVANGRPEAEDGERVLGLFLNTLPLVARVEDGSWTELARAAFEAERETLPHRRFPLAEAQRVAGRAPLVDVAFNYIHFHVYHDLLAGGVVGFQGAKFFQETEFSLVTNFYTDVHTGRVRFRLDYDRAALDEAGAAALAARYERVLAAIAADADAPHGDAALLAGEERALLAAWGTGAEVVPAGGTLPALFAARAAHTPGAVALVTGHERLTYAELAARADRLARRLAARGVGAGTVVGVCTGRSAELAVGMLGTMAAGGVYLPLDPGYPAARLAYMLEDSAARVVVTTSALADRVPAGIEPLLLDRDADDAELPAPAGVGPDDAAYLVYTSGSTGAPKGVVVAHGQAAAHCAAAVEAFGLTADDVVLHFASASFDVSIEQLLPPLSVGARVVVRGDDVPSPAEVAALVRAQGLTVVNPPTGLWEQLVRDPGCLAALRATRLVIAGGDVMHASAVRAWDEGEGPARLLNAYGPTEAVITAAAWEVPAGFAGERVPVGRPLPGRRLYVVGEDGRPVPPGAPGELCIGGSLLARGYQGRDEATGERFVADPFRGEPGARMYRTGDLARWRPDGTLEFLGRADGQVKVRGFRVELGEVEAALRAHPAVREAAAALRPDAAGTPVLAAWAVPADGATIDAAALRSFLGTRLPAHAVPTAFAVVGALPLTPNGKVDRAALPDPSPAAGPEVHAPPRTPVQELLAELWAEVLGVERVGVHDDFFARGGHSLLATRLVAKVRDALTVELPLRALFEAPTVAEFAARVEAALHGVPGEEVPAPARVGRDGPLPLSSAQRRIWLLEMMEPGRAWYHLPAVFRLRGALDAGALERALAALADRHEALRTVVREVDGEPAQVAAGAAFTLSTRDVSRLPAGQRDEAAMRAAEDEARRPFDLAAGPLFRALLVRVAADDHLLALTLHHVIADGASLRVLLGDLSALYGAFAAGEEPAAPAPALGYADHAAWERALLSDKRVAREVAWWRERLAGAPPVLALPTDRPRTAAPSHRGAVHRFHVGRETAEALRRVGRAAGATPFMTLLAGFQGLLARWSGADEVVVGTPVSGRARPWTGEMVGLFATTLPVRAAVGGEASFRDLLAHVREAVLDTMSHAEVPFERVVEELRPERSPGRHPVFQAVLALNHDAPADLLALGGVRAEPVLVENGAAKFDLSLFLTERPDGFSAALEYATDLFDAATAERLAAHLRALLAAAAADPDAPLAALPLAGEAERERVRGWSAAPPAAGVDAPVHRAFEEVAAAAPDAVAVSRGEEKLTYAQLDAAASRLARELRARGVGPETRVGVALERSPELVVAQLAVLKAGGAYVPLDASYPAARLAFMLSDADVRVLVVRGEVPAPLASFAGAVVSLDADAATIAARDAAPLDAGAGPESLAYVMYTSGSTGAPKGVAVPHRAVVRLARSGCCAMEGETFLLLSPAAFDASTLEVWGPLLNGGRVAVFPPETPSVPSLARVLRDEGVTSLWLTAGLFHQVAEAAPGAFGGLRQLLAGGDVVSPAHARRVLDANPGLTLIDGYGPTENTTFTACHAMRDAAEVRDPVPLGAPVGGTVAYVLDAAMRPVPAGVPGELYVGGAGLARGYLGRPARTAETFVPDPFSCEPGARLYRTGDRVRWIERGSADVPGTGRTHARAAVLEFLGRLDAQVKLRGFRVEPGEVEAAMHGHPGVAEAAAAVHGEGDDRRLLAFYVPAAVSAPAPAELRDFLRARLPEHLLPAAVRAVDSIPLTPNGKVDRAALAAAWTPGGEAVHVPPRDEVEAAVAALFAELLGMERVGAEDGFFELGGHSLLAIRAASRLTEAFRFEVPARLVFETPTVAALARALEAREPAPGQVRKVAAILARIRAMAAEEVRARLAGSAPAAEVAP